MDGRNPSPIASSMDLRAVRDALLAVYDALERDLAPEVRGLLRTLTYQPPDHVPAVVRRLAALTEDGERP